MKLVDIYSDGAYVNKIVTWGFIVVFNSTEIYRKRDILPPVFSEGRQVPGELKGAIEGIKWSKINNYKCNIFYDYLGIYRWVSDLFGHSNKWRTNKFYTQQYRAFIKENLEWINSFKKVKSHSGNLFNELVDKFISSPATLDELQNLLDEENYYKELNLVPSLVDY